MDFETNLDAAGANTRISLSYADASNYKAHQDVVVAGRLSPEHLARMESTLQDGEFMIPGQVGLPDLQASMSTGWGEDDHVFHTISGIELTDDAPTVDLTVDAMMGAWPADARGWDVVGALDRVAPRGYGGI